MCICVCVRVGVCVRVCIRILGEDNYTYLALGEVAVTQAEAACETGKAQRRE